MRFNPQQRSPAVRQVYMFLMYYIYNKMTANSLQK